MPIPASRAVSVVRLTSSFRRLLRYFCLADLASSSVNDGSPFRFRVFFSLKYSSENFRPSSSICVGVKSGLRAPCAEPSVSRRPLCGRSGGGGNALTKLYPSSSASVPLSLGDCDCDDVFLRFLPFASDIARLGGFGRFRVPCEEGTDRSGEGLRISSLWRRYGSSSPSMSEDVGASSRASEGSDSCDMSPYFNSRYHAAHEYTSSPLEKVNFTSDACVRLEVARTRKWCRGRNCWAALS
jgi:hypothetical protein